ncbi:hypothetical protein [Pseudomonas fluorescens]|uniref:hypothetical protein n=1 Tax=Pseudomonas fluorescens TaxID=294 RepID=UPI002B1E80DC|nr:hypothetical protein [Pseudomonas fluorescens]
MNKATLKPMGPSEEYSALQLAHQRLTLMLANSTFPPAFTKLDTRTRLGIRENSSIEVTRSNQAN